MKSFRGGCSECGGVFQREKNEHRGATGSLAAGPRPRCRLGSSASLALLLGPAPALATTRPRRGPLAAASIHAGLELREDVNESWQVLLLRDLRLGLAAAGGTGPEQEGRSVAWRELAPCVHSHLGLRLSAGRAGSQPGWRHGAGGRPSLGRAGGQDEPREGWPPPHLGGALRDEVVAALRLEAKLAPQVPLQGGDEYGGLCCAGEGVCLGPRVLHPQRQARPPLGAGHRAFGVRAHSRLRHGDVGAGIEVLEVTQVRAQAAEEFGELEGDLAGGGG